MTHVTLTDLRDLLVRSGGIPKSLRIDDPTTRFTDLGLDSAVLLALQVEIERTYDITLLPDDLLEFETVGAGVALINSKIGRRSTA
ncbi:MAG TPA: acyl carrier protein [Chloroflexota bacterium]|nr:acyl carrier protein [Chloroflexota bacterium]